jgi:hypothetical protein
VRPCWAHIAKRPAWCGALSARQLE